MPTETLVSGRPPEAPVWWRMMLAMRTLVWVRRWSSGSLMSTSPGVGTELFEGLRDGCFDFISHVEVWAAAFGVVGVVCHDVVKRVDLGLLMESRKLSIDLERRADEEEAVADGSVYI